MSAQPYITRRRRRPRHTSVAHRRIGVPRLRLRVHLLISQMDTRPDTPRRTGTPARARGAAQVPLPASRANAEVRTHVGLGLNSSGLDPTPERAITGAEVPWMDGQAIARGALRDVNRISRFQAKIELAAGLIMMVWCRSVAPFPIRACPLETRDALLRS